MKNKGFTLVELIVVIIVMGLVLIVAFPSINKLNLNNKHKSVIGYGNAMIAAAKLYVDQYEEDLFANDSNGVKTITYDNLRNADLLKPYNDPKIKCKLSSSRVTVKKEGSKYKHIYTYTYNLNCIINNKNTTCQGTEKKSSCS